MGAEKSSGLKKEPEMRKEPKGERELVRGCTPCKGEFS